MRALTAAPRRPTARAVRATAPVAVAAAPRAVRRPALAPRRGVAVVEVPPVVAARLPRPPASYAANAPASFADDPPPAAAFSEAARKALFRAADVTRRVGWASFWAQLALSLTSAGILLFSVAFTAQNGPAVALYATLFGVVAAFLSTFWAYGYTRLARRLRALAAAAARGGPLPADMVRKGDVVATLRAGCYVNIAGLAATLLGLQATVGLLVAKTLSNATANPFLAGGAGSYSPVLALDVFLVQASTNTALCHFASLLASLWLIRSLGAPAPAPPGAKPAPV